MYAQSVINQRLELAQAGVRFNLTEHSISKCDEWAEHLNSILDEDGNLDASKRPSGLLPEERRWIRNERIYCQASYPYWSTRYARIRTIDERITHYQPNVAQKINASIRADLESQGHSIEIMQPKARRLGVSTDTELVVSHRSFFYPNVNAITASSDPEKSREMSKMLELCYDTQPWWLKPTLTKYKSGEILEFGEMNTGISIQHGAQFTGIARGATPSICHLSEVVDFDDPKELIDASLLRAIIPTVTTFIVLESTCKGLGNWWHDTWTDAKDNWPKGRSRLQPVFLPWYVGTDIYPSPAWIHKHPVPEDWQPELKTLQHAEKAAKFVASYDLLRKYLGEGWRMPLAQMWYWEFERGTYIRKKELPIFLSEMPADDLEAFTSTQVSAFDVETIEDLNNRVRPPAEIYSIIGAEIPSKFHPDPREIDTSKPRLRVTSNWNHQAVYTYEFIPMKFNGYDNTTWEGRLLLWEKPEREEEYGCGLDTGQGIGKDRTSLQIMRKGNLYRNDSQVGEFVSPWLNALDVWPYCLAVGTFFSTWREGRFVQPRMVIEMAESGGLTQNELKKRGWNNFHQWKRYDSVSKRYVATDRQGWWTVGWSRREAMDKGIKAVRDGWLEINSPHLVKELTALEADETRQLIKAMYGAHDDRWMSLIICYFSLHDLETESSVRRERPSTRFGGRNQLPTLATSRKPLLPSVVPGAAVIDTDYE